VGFQVSAQPLAKKTAGLIEVVNKIPIYIRGKSNALQCFDDEFSNRQAEKCSG
jgi:hypothetical protein